jgi:[ribosomal protein S5]-alanine N-acetyltransferase
MLQINFTPFPNLETERLLLRRLTNADISNIIALRGNPETMQYIPRPLIENEEQAMAHLKMIDDNIENNKAINWGVYLKESFKFIGFMGIYQIQPENFRAEIGYMILTEYSSKGFTTEAIKAIITYGFEVLQFHSMQGVIDPRNIASERVLQKNGFVKEAHFIENEFAMGKFWDGVVYSLLKRNFVR